MKTFEWAIIDKDTKEFYADPIYTDLERACDKIKYLNGYRVANNMAPKEYIIEKLTDKRREEHEKEWNQFVAAID